ncbi:MAG: LON peptidase substrate-binding domain-containing protein [Alphaproteobacteria bacterium]
MTPLAYAPGIDALPETLPIFPLAGVLLLPRGRLPLNIFEPRYLAMTRDAIAGDHLIGMVQPLDAASEGEPQPAVYRTGCTGRITDLKETDDGRYLIILTGLCRFTIAGELPLNESGYRRVRVVYGVFADDLGPADDSAVDRVRLGRVLKDFFETGDEVAIDWRSIERTPSESLVVSLSMTLPFSPSEKQALLEARDLAERTGILISLMEMMAAQEQTGAAARVQ